MNIRIRKIIYFQYYRETLGGNDVKITYQPISGYGLFFSTISRHTVQILFLENVILSNRLTLKRQESFETYLTQFNNIKQATLLYLPTLNTPAANSIVRTLSFWKKKKSGLGQG